LVGRRAAFLEIGAAKAECSGVDLCFCPILPLWVKG